MHERGVNPYIAWTLDFAKASAAVANYCDHVEHNEPADRAWVTDAGRAARGLASAIATCEHEDLIALYAARLRQIERRNPLWSEGELDGGALALNASTWRDLQLAQIEHDRHYHPDVLGLTKQDQLRHYALHIAKLVGAIAEIATGSGDAAGFRTRRLPDLLLFGIKLSTVCGEQLDETPLSPVGAVLQTAGR